jgi:hypothetical protein
VPIDTRTVSDEFTVPVCRLNHRELHRYGDEASWWAAGNVDPMPIALELWRRSRPLQFPEGSDFRQSSNAKAEVDVERRRQEGIVPR